MEDKQLVVFKDDRFGTIRTITDDAGRPWFVAKDVAISLGYIDSTNAIKAHCKGVVKRNLPTAGGKQSINIIPESDLYRLIMNSKLPSAEDFQYWVFEEVLPSIRKTCEVLDNIEYTGNIDGIVYSCNGVATTTSVNIAAVFCKDHKTIIRAIENKINSGNKTLAQFCADHIKEVIYLDSFSRPQKQYELDEEGFSFIGFGLTGERADDFKIKYIEAFSRMKAAINNMFKARVVESVLPQDSRSRLFIYIIKNPLNDTIKVGVAQDVEKRIKQLQTGAGIELELVYQSLVCSNAFSIEKTVHVKFEKFRTFGEWFKVHPEEVIYFLEQQTFILKSEFLQYVSPLRDKVESRRAGIMRRQNG